MEKKKFSGWSVMVGCFLLFFFGAGLLSNTAGLFMNPVCEEMGIDTTVYSVLPVFTSLANAIASAFLVSKLQTGNMKRIMGVAIVVTGLGFAAYGLCQNIWQLCIAGFVTNLGVAFLTYVPIGMMITNWFIEKRSIAMSISMCGANIGGAVWSMVLAEIMQRWGWRNTYFIGAVISGVTMFLILIFLLKKSPEQYGQEPYTRRSTDTGGHAETAAEEEWEGLEKKTALRTPSFIFLAAAMFLVGLYFAGITTHVINFLLSENWTLSVAAAAFSVNQIAGMVGMLVSGVLIQRFGLKACASGSGLIMFLSCLALALTPNVPALAYAYSVLAGLAYMMTAVIPSLMVSSVFGTRDYSGIYGSINTFFMLGCAAGAAVVAVASNTLGYVGAWYVCSVACLLIILFCYLSLKLSAKFRDLYPNRPH